MTTTYIHLGVPLTVHIGPLQQTAMPFRWVQLVGQDGRSVEADVKVYESGDVQAEGSYPGLGEVVRGHLQCTKEGE